MIYLFWYKLSKYLRISLDEIFIYLFIELIIMMKEFKGHKFIYNIGISNI